MANFPTSYDSLTDPVGGHPRNTPGMEEVTLISNLNDAVGKIEAYVGTSTETSVTTLTGKVKQFDKATTKGDLLYHDGTQIARLPRGSDGYILASDATDGVKYIAPTSGGTVTDVSVVSANGFTGSVANATTSPDITITTSVTGLLKGNGTAVSSATQGTDYFAPGGTDVGVADGGTGVSTLTAFAPIFGGTTTTGPIQQVSVGTVGQVLTSNGAGALPTMQNIPGWIPLHNGTVTSISNSPVYDTGTLTSYDRYMIVFELTGTANLDVGLQVNGQTSGIYISTQYQNSSISSTSSTTATILSSLSVTPINYMGGGNYYVKAKGSNKFIYGSGFSGNRLLDSAITYASDITSFQIFRFSGTGTFSGFFKVYGQNN